MPIMVWITVPFGYSGQPPSQGLRSLKAARPLYWEDGYCDQMATISSFYLFLRGDFVNQFVILSSASEKKLAENRERYLATLWIKNSVNLRLVLWTFLRQSQVSGFAGTLSFLEISPEFWENFPWVLRKFLCFWRYWQLIRLKMSKNLLL